MALRVLSSLLLWAGMAAAQVEIGRPAPPLPVVLQGGGPLRLGGDGAAPVAVLAFHATLPGAAADGDLLRMLRVRHKDLAVAVIVPAAAGELPAGLRDLPLAIDAGGAARAAWLGRQPSFHVVVVDEGQVVFAGRPEEGLGAVVAAAVAGDVDVRAERAAQAARQRAVETFGDADGPGARVAAQALLDHCPTDGLAWGLRYLAEAERLRDRAAADAVRERALAALAREPRALAAFADLALRGDRQNRQLAAALAAPLQDAARAFPDDLRVQLACLRALVQGGQGREVGRAAHLLARKVEDHGPAALEFVDILTQDEPAAVHLDLCTQVLQRAGQLGADARLLTAARYAVARCCAEDRAAAKAIADPYMDALGSRVAINNDAWYLMTELPTAGRFDVFALALVERMLEQREAMDDFEFDTAALAMFRAGRVDEAVTLQQRAVDKAGKDHPGYALRLARYRAAPAPR